MQALINSEKNLISAKIKVQTLPKRTIIEVQEIIPTKLQKTPSSIKFKYPTNGLYGLL